MSDLIELREKLNAARAALDHLSYVNVYNLTANELATLDVRIDVARLAADAARCEYESALRRAALDSRKP